MHRNLDPQHRIALLSGLTAWSRRVGRGSHPGQIRNNPGLMRVYPGLSGFDPGLIRVYPGWMRDRPAFPRIVL